MPASSLDQLVSLCKRRGFIFPGSEIYGGLANTWDYGPLGVELKNRVKREWWKTFVHKRGDMVGVDAAILMNPKVWEASGHVTSFSDPLIECKECHYRTRADKMMEEWVYFKEDGNYESFFTRLIRGIQPLLKVPQKAPLKGKQKITIPLKLSFKLKDDDREIKTDSLNITYDFDLNAIDKRALIHHFFQEILRFNCPNCGKTNWTEPKQFNLMFRTQQGVIEGEGNDIYLRPETAQGIFVNFRNILDTMRPRLPFGVAQIGKAFRNEITPGNFTFRTREFEQMEIEYFVEPGKEKEIFEEWKELVWNWYLSLGIEKKNLRIREHDKEELSHYSSRTIDIEYQFPWGWGELFGLANRGDFDLKQHEKFSGEDLTYTDPDDATKKFLPHVVEPSFGCDRTVLTFLLEAYTEEDAPTASGGSEKRVVMKFDPRLAPVDVAILPLSKKEHLIAKAQELYKKIIQETDLVVDFDVTGSIGKRYRRQDEIGTPRCITVDFGTLGEDDKQGTRDTVTIRDRDTLKQERVAIGGITEKLQ
ncbi:MAG: glycine--tRNA ligase [Candidatus Peribacteraceae bacterium]|nr:glycine--tRNA ligase [Candidatus Peribacteraceae bacterium]